MRGKWMLGVAAALGLAAGVPAGATVLGGGPATSDCYVTFDGITSANGRTVECADGDAACDADGTADGRCTFAITVCVKQAAEGCTAGGNVTRIKGATRFLANRPALPASAPACGTPNTVVVSLKNNGTRPGKRTIRTLGLSDGNPRKDADQFTLRCVPPAAPAS
jgi:hypothetical protein